VCVRACDLSDCLMRASSFPHEKPKKETLEMLQVLFRMKNVVLSFGTRTKRANERAIDHVAHVSSSVAYTAETFEESDCPTIHVRGERTLFSCYRVGQLVRPMLSRPRSMRVAARVHECSLLIDRTNLHDSR